MIEGRPGIIESTHIEPLKEITSRQRTIISVLTFPDFSYQSYVCAERDQWEDVGITSTGAESSGSGMMKTAIDLGNATSSMLTGAMKMAYGSVAGNEEAFKAGKEAVYGKGA